jgi:hypothetical protein
MDQYLDEQILPRIRQHSEDLREDKFFLNTPWLEFRDDENFHEAILHFFHEDGEYLRCVDGNCKSGKWRYLDGVNKMLIDFEKTSQLYDLAFLDNDFFILDKHGDQTRLKERKYYVMVNEKVGKKLEWRDVMELLYNRYQNSLTFFLTLIFIVVAILIMFLYFT